MFLVDLEEILSLINAGNTFGILIHMFQVSAVPSVIAVKDGKVVDKFVGLQEENRIESFINGVINE